MKRRTMIIFACCIPMLLSACGKTSDGWEDGELGDIDETAEYEEPENMESESLVERGDESDIHDYYGKIPISMTEKQSGTLPDVSGTEYPVQRFEMNGVSFDINSFAVNTGFNDFVDDLGVYQMDLSNGDVSVKIAQIAQGDTATLRADEEVYHKYLMLQEEYYSIYDASSEAKRDDHGGVYTYDAILSYIEEHPELRKDYLIYSPSQHFQVIKEAFGLEEEFKDFEYNENASFIDYSNMYESLDSFWRHQDGRETKIIVKRTEGGVFAFLVEWNTDCNMNLDDGTDLYSPSILINLSRDKQWLNEESRDNFIAREGDVLY